jgi:hypothetical protein
MRKMRFLMAAPPRAWHNTREEIGHDVTLGFAFVAASVIVGFGFGYPVLVAAAAGVIACAMVFFGWFFKNCVVQISQPNMHPRWRAYAQLNPDTTVTLGIKSRVSFQDIDGIACEVRAPSGDVARAEYAHLTKSVTGFYFAYPRF